MHIKSQRQPLDAMNMTNSCHALAERKEKMTLLDVQYREALVA